MSDSRPPHAPYNSPCRQNSCFDGNTLKLQLIHTLNEKLSNGIKQLATLKKQPHHIKDIGSLQQSIQDLNDQLIFVGPKYCVHKSFLGISNFKTIINLCMLNKESFKNLNIKKNKSKLAQTTTQRAKNCFGEISLVMLGY